jgi:hypothetical protein
MEGTFQIELRQQADDRVDHATVSAPWPGRATGS